MQRPLRTKLIMLAGVLAVAMLLVACGGDDDAKTSTTTQQTAAPTSAGTTAATATPEAGDDTATATPDEGGGGGGTEINACALLTNDEISEEVGTEATDGVPIDADPLHNCLWQGDGFTVNLDVITTDPDTAAEYYEGTGGETELQVDGIGEKARWTTDSEIVVLEGSVTLVISSLSVHYTDASLEPTKRLAAKAVARLP